MHPQAVVVVAIFPEPQPVKLLRLFWKELRLIGTRVYEPEDFTRAIALVDGGTLPLARLITRVEPLDSVPGALASPASASTRSK